MFECCGQTTFFPIAAGNATGYNPAGGKFGNYTLVTEPSNPTARNCTLKIKLYKHVCVCWFANRHPHIESKARPRKEVHHSRLIGAEFLSKGTYIGACLEFTESSYLGTAIYSVQMISATPYSLKPASLKTTPPTVEMVHRIYTSKTGEGGSEEPPTAWMNFVGSTGNHIPSRTSFNSVQWFTVMLVIAKHWKQPECPTLVTGLIWYIYAIK